MSGVIGTIREDSFETIMKIVILGTRGFPHVQGGVETHCEFLATNLVRLGCEVIVFTRAPYVNKTVREYQGVQLTALPAFRNKFLETLLHTFIGVLAARTRQPDILHIQAIGPGLFVALARTLGMRVVLTTHGSNYKHQKWGPGSKLFLRFCEFVGLRFADQVIAISHTIGEEVRSQYGREVTVIPNGVVIPPREEGSRALETYGLEKQRYILAIGRLVAGKGFTDLINAFRYTSGASLRLIIVGDVDHEDDYSRRLKEQAHQTPGVVLTGFLTGRSLAELYSHAGLYVLPSYYEGLSLSLLEAMSYGLSCVVSDIPANREVGLPGERLFRAGDVDALAQKIQRFISRPPSEPEKKKQIDLIRERYDWGQIARQTLQVYDQVKGAQEIKRSSFPRERSLSRAPVLPNPPEIGPAKKTEGRLGKSPGAPPAGPP